MKNIEEIIEELVEIGNRYLKLKNTFFSPHTHQAFARNLFALNINQPITPDERIKRVEKVVSSIYWNVSKPGLLIQDIHKCLCAGVNFQPYAKVVSDQVENAMKEERYDILSTMSDYRAAIDPGKKYVPKTPVHEYTYTS